MTSPYQKARPNGPPFFSRNQIAAALHQVAVLLELQGANVFRLRSYQNASRTLGGITEDLGELVATGKIFEIKESAKVLVRLFLRRFPKAYGPMTG